MKLNWPSVTVLALVLPHSILFYKASHHEEFLGSLAAEVPKNENKLQSLTK